MNEKDLTMKINKIKIELDKKEKELNETLGKSGLVDFKLAQEVKNLRRERYSLLNKRAKYLAAKEARKEAIKEGLGLPNKWDISTTLQTAIDFYESFKSESALLLEDMNMVIEKLRASLKDIDFKLLDDKGRPIYTLKDVTATLKQIPELVEELKKIETVINSEFASSTKMRGNQEKTILDDGITL